MSTSSNTELPFMAVSAPMVRYSKVAFRELVKRHGVNLAYTPMIMADSFLASPAARHQELPILGTPLGTRRDIVQFAANEALIFKEAAKLVEPFCAGVDLNCGCPQRWAQQAGVGSALLRQHQLLYDMARECTSAVSVPVSVKIRLDPTGDIRKTIDLCRSLTEMAGISVITVHGRTPSQKHSDPVDYDAIRLVKEAMRPNVRVFANGDIFTRDDALEVYNLTKVDGVMAARGLLINPSLFEIVQRNRVELAQEYTELAISLGTTFHLIHHHVSQMLTESPTGLGTLPPHLHKQLNCLTSVSGIIDFLDSL